MKHFDYVIVGAGLFGSVCAERLTRKGKSVLVVEKRNHIGGNCYSFEYEETSITVHKYGTHIFHTNDRSIWEYVRQFTQFNRYQHRVLTTCRGRIYALPINLGTVNAFFGLALTPQQLPDFLAAKREDIARPANLEEKALSLVGRELYEAFFRGYTIKQWQRDPRELPAEVITRLPVRASYFDAYYDDAYQGIPLEGYTRIFERMLQGIAVELGVDFLDDREYWLGRCDRLIYTGPIDRYYEHRLGRLGWRSVMLETERLDIDDFQGTSVMNYADPEVPYTRIHEPRHLHRERPHTPGTTVIMREYSSDNADEPYYPINSPQDQRLLERYQQLASRDKRVVFGGRLAQYRYFDMHHAIAAALSVTRDL